MKRLFPTLFLLVLAASCAAKPSNQTASSPPPTLPASTPIVTPTAAATPAAATAAPSVTPASTPMPSPTPSATPELAPASSAPTNVRAPSTPAPSAIPSASPSVHPKVVQLPSQAPPQIERVSISANTVHSGDTLHGTVITSSNTASVEARIVNYSISIPKVGVGRFALAYKVPWIPFFWHGTYQMILIARNTAGVQARQAIPITVR